MATGKTNSRHIKVQVDDASGTLRDISLSVSNVSAIGNTHEETDVTAYGDGRKNVTLGHPEDPLEFSGPLNNTATTGGHIVFAGIVGSETTRTVTIDIGIRAAAATGDPRWTGEYICSSYRVNGDGTYTARMVAPASEVAAIAWTTVP